VAIGGIDNFDIILAMQISVLALHGVCVANSSLWKNQRFAAHSTPWWMRACRPAYGAASQNSYLFLAYGDF